MTLAKRSNLGKTASVHDDDADAAPQRRLGVQAPRDVPVAANNGSVVPIAGNSALAEAQKRKARTFARQQKAAERIAAATSQLASGITEARVGRRRDAQGRRPDRVRRRRGRRRQLSSR